MSEPAEEESARKGVSIPHRLDLVERDVRQHSLSVTGMIDAFGGLERRIVALEDWKMNRQIAEAREDERDRSLYERLTRIEESIKGGLTDVNGKIGKITGFGNRIFWIAMGSIIPAVVLVVAIVIVFGIKVVPGLPLT